MMCESRAEPSSLLTQEERAVLAEVRDVAAAVALLRRWGLIVDDVDAVPEGASHHDIPVRVDRDGRTCVTMIRIHLRREA
jgi:hypothetical protein